MAQPVALTLSALLPPSIINPSVCLPSPSFALLGPLPATTPIHLALNYLALSDLPEYESFRPKGHEGVTAERVNKDAGRVLVVTCSRRAWTEEIMDEDEDWLRERGGEYGTLQRLKRIDIRACPTLGHLKLLLTLLTCRKDSAEDAVGLDRPPGLVILWNIGCLLTHQVEEDENLPPGADRDKMGQWELNHGICLSDFMDVISAAKAAQQHFTSLAKVGSATQLVILEPHFDHLTSLPIFKTLSDLRADIATPQRERRVTIKHALEWALGDVVGVITEEGGDEMEIEKRYTVKIPNEIDVFHMKKRLCERDTIANPRGRRELDGRSVDDKGWRWEWTM